jgi:hypothetical protein
LNPLSFFISGAGSAPRDVPASAISAAQSGQVPAAAGNHHDPDDHYNSCVDFYFFH